METQDRIQPKGRWAVLALVVALGAGLLAATPAQAAVFATYRVTTDVSARTTPTAAAGSGYGIPSGGSFGVQCQVIGQPVGPRGNTLYFSALYQGRSFYVPDTWTTSPHKAGQPPIAGIPMCRPPANPAPSPRTIGNRVADLALTYQGRWGGQACIDSALGSKGYVGGYSGGQCRQFVNCLIYRASGHRYNPTSADYSFTGASRVAMASAVRGDLIQWGVGGHTAIVLRNYGAGRFQVVDSNHAYDERVMVYDRTLSGTFTIWRYGQQATG